METGLTKLETQHKAWAGRCLFFVIALSVLVAIFYQASGYEVDLGVYFKVGGFDPLNASALLSVYVLMFFARPSRKLGLITTGVGLALEVVYSLIFLPPGVSLLSRLTVSGGGLGVAGFLTLVYLAINGEPESKSKARTYIVVALCVFLYPETGGKLIGFLSFLTPEVHDYCAYLTEGSLGFYPSQEVARWLEAHPLVDLLCQNVYSRLTLFVILGALLASRAKERQHWDVLGATFVTVFAAFCLYYVLPMVGIDYFVGRPPWPNGELPSLTSLKSVAAPPNWPRTCIPSVHTAWILIPFLATWRMSRKHAAFFGLMAVCTIAAAMSERVGHYSLDVLVGFPHAVAGMAATMIIENPSLNSYRWKVFALCSSLTVIPIVLLRLLPEVLAIAPVLSWLGFLSLIPISLACFNILDRKIEGAE